MRGCLSICVTGKASTRQPACFYKLWNRPQNEMRENSRGRKIISVFWNWHLLLGLLFIASHFPHAIKHVHQPHWSPSTQINSNIIWGLKLNQQHHKLAAYTTETRQLKICSESRPLLFTSKTQVLFSVPDSRISFLYLNPPLWSFKVRSWLSIL